MKRKRARLDYLRDMLAYAEKAEAFVGQMDYESFRVNEERTLAVVRALEIIGEAARNIPVEMRRRHSDVPWSKMVSMRNIVIHGYFGVDSEVIWKTVHEDLPPLRAALARILADLEGGGKLA
ncbi:MAG: DUF86 domain-containing protein [Chloroflexi bacterium]|nr:DUF86 domain-containing protein [Chloroflexota bacterium]